MTDSGMTPFRIVVPSAHDMLKVVQTVKVFIGLGLFSKKGYVRKSVDRGSNILRKGGNPPSPSICLFGKAEWHAHLLIANGHTIHSVDKCATNVCVCEHLPLPPYGGG